MKQGEILFFLGSICIVVFAWIAFGVLHNATTSTISSATTQAILPIQATFDRATINAIQKRLVVSPAYTILPGEKETVVTTSPISSPSASPIASGGAQLQ